MNIPETDRWSGWRFRLLKKNHATAAAFDDAAAADDDHDDHGDGIDNDIEALMIMILMYI